jgi:hypothetical protein
MPERRLDSREVNAEFIGFYIGGIAGAKLVNGDPVFIAEQMEKARIYLGQSWVTQSFQIRWLHLYARDLADFSFPQRQEDGWVNSGTLFLFPESAGGIFSPPNAERIEEIYFNSFVSECVQMHTAGANLEELRKRSRFLSKWRNEQEIQYGKNV